MTDNGEHIPQGERQPGKTSKLPPESVVAYRKSLSGDNDQPYDHYKYEKIKDFDDILDKLPKEDSVYAAELYSLLALDESAALRKQVARHVHNLYIHDKEAGTVLFTCLINDFVAVVRNSAFDSIEKSSYEGAILYDDFKAMREEYYDACDRASIRDGALSLRLVDINQEPWSAQTHPWQLSVKTAVEYISELEAKQRNARESAAHVDFYSELHYLPGENLPLAIELLTALAAHENSTIRARIPVFCSHFLYAYDKQAAIGIANTLQQDQDYTIAASVKPAFAEAAVQRGYDYNEIMRALDIPTPHDKLLKPTFTLLQGGKTQLPGI